MRLFLALFTCILITACGRYAPGFILTNDGQTLANNDINNRSNVIESIRSQLDAQLGEHWRTVVTLPELPIYAAEGGLSQNQCDWIWPSAHATIELVGDGAVPLPTTIEAIHKAVVEYLEPKVDRPNKNLSVTVHSTMDNARFLSMKSNALIEPPTAHSPNASHAIRHYTIQAGDTLADISTVFYGSAQHWKLIRDANPNVDPANLNAGMVLTIPAKP